MLTETGLLVPVRWDSGHLLTEDCYAICLGCEEGHAHARTTSESAAPSLAAGVGVPFIHGVSADVTRGCEVLSWVVQVVTP